MADFESYHLFAKLGIFLIIWVQDLHFANFSIILSIVVGNELHTDELITKSLGFESCSCNFQVEKDIAHDVLCHNFVTIIMKEA